MYRYVNSKLDGVDRNIYDADKDIYMMFIRMMLKCEYFQY